MSQTKDPLARDRQINRIKGHPPPQVPPIEVVDERALKVWKLRTEDRLLPQQIANRLKLPLRTVHRDLNRKHEAIMAAIGEYGQFRRRGNEKELEDFKTHCARYIYDPKVVARGSQIDSDGKMRVIELSHFEMMIKVMPFYLAAMNIQNKMWGLYTVPNAPSHGDAPGTMNIKNVAIMAVDELKRIARKAEILPPQIKDEQ
jgi:hypothetical protein